jgi:hypothetical protein
LVVEVVEFHDAALKGEHFDGQGDYCWNGLVLEIGCSGVCGVVDFSVGCCCFVGYAGEESS